MDGPREAAKSIVYEPPPGMNRLPRRLVEVSGPAPRTFPFAERLEIGRGYEGRPVVPGVLLLDDPTVSARHCVISRRPDGRCLVRDVSRNGTRVDGRRLVPNVEIVLAPGQTVTVGPYRFRFEEDAIPAEPAPAGRPAGTLDTYEAITCTVLVGDVRDYTGIVQRTGTGALQRPLNRVFEALREEIGTRGGTVKEYQGDAVLAFWEASPSGEHVPRACEAALALDRMARTLARDPGVWGLPNEPLRMDWALATGPVTLDTFGADGPLGLSMIGEPVVLAFRLEKLADDDRGSVLVCPITRAGAGDRFRFRELGPHLPPGYRKPIHVFALEGSTE